MRGTNVTGAGFVGAVFFFLVAFVVGLGALYVVAYAAAAGARAGWGG